MANALGDNFSLVLDIKQARRSLESPYDFINQLGKHIKQATIVMTAACFILVKHLLQLFCRALIRASEKVAVYVCRGARPRVACSACDRHQRYACCDLHRDIGVA